MKTFHASILEVRRIEAGQTGILLNLPASAAPQPGQYFAASRGDITPLPTILFPYVLSADGCLFLTDGALSWQAGERLALRGPLGRGFSLPKHAARVALAALGEGTAHLRLLMQTCLRNGAAVVLCSDQMPPDLPPQVEVLPLAHLPEASTWADCLAIDSPPERLPHLLRLAREERAFGAVPVQALVRRAMPCAGLGACGVCAQKIRRGYALACQDGPVFDLAQLEAA